MIWYMIYDSGVWQTCPPPTLRPKYKVKEGKRKQGIVRERSAGPIAQNQPYQPKTRGGDGGVGVPLGLLELEKGSSRLRPWNKTALRNSVDIKSKRNSAYQLEKLISIILGSDKALGHVHIEVVIFFILYLPSNICLYGGLFLCMFEENGSHKTRINNKSVTEG